jgi:hypothetical protein
MKTIAALILWSWTLAACAQAPMGGSPRPPGPPSPEALATVPNLTATQQTELRKILIERRDAHEAIEAKSRAEHEAVAKKDRGEHERIDEQSADRLRKLLGDDGFRQFAQWRLEHHGGGSGPAPGPRDAPRHGAHPPGAGKVSALPDVAAPNGTTQTLAEKTPWRAKQRTRSIRIWRCSSAAARWARYAHLVRQVWPGA